MMENILEVLLSQHSILKKEVANMKEEAEKSSPVLELILNYENKFKNELINHLNLENNVFYPQLLEKMKRQGTDVTDTTKFIEKMKEIEKKVTEFFEKYADIQNIKNNFENFKNDLNNMISTLLIRIESEEQGVYLYWQ